MSMTHLTPNCSKTKNGGNNGRFVCECRVNVSETFTVPHIDVHKRICAWV